MKDNNLTRDSSVLYGFISHCCVIFTIISLVFNCFYSILLWPLLPNIGVNLLTLLISFIPALIILLVRYKLKKPLINTKMKIVYSISVVYSSIFIIFNISTVFFKDVWNLYTILIILLLSIIISIIRYYVPISNYLIKTIIYFIVLAIPYFIITLAFAGLGKGNAIIIVFSVYAVAYIISSVTIFLIIRARAKAENNNKSYKKQFK
ncbi:MAG: hypothetical protein IJ437_02965 [Clostridia bacterium]|nr:hypothetical protein [Clostridia bacterium]